MAVAFLRLLGLGLGIKFVLLLHETRVKSDCTGPCKLAGICGNNVSVSLFGGIQVSIPGCLAFCKTAGYADGTCTANANCDGGVCVCTGVGNIQGIPIRGGGNPNNVDSLVQAGCQLLCTVACAKCNANGSPYLGHRCSKSNSTHPGMGEPYGAVCQCCLLQGCQEPAVYFDYYDQPVPTPPRPRNQTRLRIQIQTSASGQEPAQYFDYYNQPPPRNQISASGGVQFSDF